MQEDLDLSEDGIPAMPMRPTRSEPPRPPPCPKGKGKGLGKAKVGRDSKLINFFWRPSVKPSETDLSTVDDPYIAEMKEFMPNLEDEPSMESEDSSAEFTSGEPLGVASEPLMSRFRGRRKTIFTCDLEVRMIPDKKLQELFQARAPSVDLRSTQNLRTLIADNKHLQILEIMVKNYTVKKQVSVEEAVEGLVVAIRQCDYDQLESHMLGGLQKVVDAHLQQEKPDAVTVLQYADRNGPEALLQLEHPHAHRLLHGVASIPEVSARLECMHKDATFDDVMEGCETSLKILREGLVRLVACLPAIQSFFVACLQLGNAVNTGSAAPVARHGFKLCALQKLLDVKAPNKPGLSLFQVAVAMMTPEIAAQLCSPDLANALLQAKLARGASVYKDCLRALESFQVLATVAHTGVFKGREIPRTAHRPQGASARLAASTDNFWPRMLALAERGKPVAARVKRLCISVVHGYNDLGLYFDDAMCLWPPPQDDQDKEKLDLYAVFHDFVTNFARARTEVELTRFVSEVQKRFSYSFALGSQAEPEPETVPVRASSLTPRKRASQALTPRGNLGFDLRDLSPARPRARTPQPQRSPTKVF